MVWSKVNFYLGFLYTRQDLILNGLFDEETDQVNPEFSAIVHQWKCCAALADELFVVGKLLTTAKRIKRSCGQCVPVNHAVEYMDSDPFKSVCDKCKSAWLNHSVTRPEWCLKCLQVQYRFKPFDMEKKMRVLIRCNDCFCMCDKGPFNVIGMQMKEVIVFDGSTVEGRPQIMNAFCTNCDIPVSSVSSTSSCPKCSQPFQGIDRIMSLQISKDEEFKQICAKFGKQRDCHLVGMTDDCYKCC